MMYMFPKPSFQSVCLLESVSPPLLFEKACSETGPRVVRYPFACSCVLLVCTSVRQASKLEIEGAFIH